MESGGGLENIVKSQGQADQENNQRNNQREAFQQSRIVLGNEQQEKYPEDREECHQTQKVVRHGNRSFYELG
jgi:hypothetical protein